MQVSDSILNILLNFMQYHELQPDPLLAPYIKLIWVLELDHWEQFGAPETILPDGIVEAVFHFGEPMLTTYPNAPEQQQPFTFAISQTRRPIQIRPRGKTGLVSVRFYPWGAYHFFDVPVKEFSDQQIPGRFLWGRAASELEEEVFQARNNLHRVHVIERFLMERLRHHHKEEVEPLGRFLWRRRGRVSIREMSQEFGVSERQLERTFARAFGASPKRLARITRFLNACRLLREGDCEELAQVACHCGYYDQSHFTHDFRSLAGMTPGEFLVRPGVSFLGLD